MIRRLSCLWAPGHDPYQNLAREEALLGLVEEGELILYLWQNQHTVVVGRNQNCWKECRVALLEEQGGRLARRLSGGGAVYHDLGNLNFTFLVRRQDYAVERQTAVILEAVRRCGVGAEKSGRNDLTCQGRKFSGHAFYESKGAAYHHGTLMVDTDPEKLGRYLSVSRDKLKTKSVASVRARVGNLREWAPGLTVDGLCRALQEALGREYGLPVTEFAPGRLTQDALEALTQKYASSAWKYSPRLSFSYQLERRFAWGGVQLPLQVKDGRVADCALFSDGLDPTYLENFVPLLRGCPFEPTALGRALARNTPQNDAQRQMLSDLQGLLKEAL